MLQLRRGLGEHPLGMLTREPRIGAHHFGLNPQPKLHTAHDNSVSERVQSGGPAILVDGPVAQGAPVVGAPREPAIVEHETLNAQVGRRVDERHE